MGQLNIRGVDDEMVKRLKHEAVDAGKSLKDYVVEKLGGGEPRRAVSTDGRETSASPKGSGQNYDLMTAGRSTDPGRRTAESSGHGEVLMVPETAFCDTASHAETKRSQSSGKTPSAFSADRRSAEMPTPPTKIEVPDGQSEDRGEVVRGSGRKVPRNKERKATVSGPNPIREVSDIRGAGPRTGDCVHCGHEKRKHGGFRGACQADNCLCGGYE